MRRSTDLSIRIAAFALTVAGALAALGTAPASAAPGDARVGCSGGFGQVVAQPAMRDAPSGSRAAKVRVTAGLTGCSGTLPNVASGDVTIVLRYPSTSCESILSDTFNGKTVPQVSAKLRVVWRDSKGQRVATTRATSAHAGEDAYVLNFFVVSFRPVSGPYGGSMMLGVREPSPATVRTACAGSGFTGFTTDFVGLIQ
jgi:hypothetical protein